MLLIINQVFLLAHIISLNQSYAEAKTKTGEYHCDIEPAYVIIAINTWRIVNKKASIFGTKILARIFLLLGIYVFKIYLYFPNVHSFSQTSLLDNCSFHRTDNCPGRTDNVHKKQRHFTPNGNYCLYKYCMNIAGDNKNLRKEYLDQLHKEPDVPTKFYKLIFKIKSHLTFQCLSITLMSAFISVMATARSLR